jgi:hypothetical protein
MPIIYKLEHDDGRYYVGSSFSTAEVRYGKHKTNGLVREFIGEWDKVRMNVIEEVKCDTRTELNQIEQRWIDENRTELCLNRIRASRRSRSEEYKETYAKIKGTEKDWYAKHREAHREENKVYARKYYEEKKEECLRKAKEHYGANKEQIIAREKARYEANKEEINRKRRERRQKLKADSLSPHSSD